MPTSASHCSKYNVDTAEKEKNPKFQLSWSLYSSLGAGDRDRQLTLDLECESLLLSLGRALYETEKIPTAECWRV